MTSVFVGKIFLEGGLERLSFNSFIRIFNEYDKGRDSNLGTLKWAHFNRSFKHTWSLSSVGNTLSHLCFVGLTEFPKCEYEEMKKKFSVTRCERVQVPQPLRLGT